MPAADVIVLGVGTCGEDWHCVFSPLGWTVSSAASRSGSAPASRIAGAGLGSRCAATSR
jgi:hypothetical protein